MEIIGVVADARNDGLLKPVKPSVVACSWLCWNARTVPMREPVCAASVDISLTLSCESG